MAKKLANIIFLILLPLVGIFSSCTESSEDFLSDGEDVMTLCIELPSGETTKSVEDIDSFDGVTDWKWIIYALQDDVLVWAEHSSSGNVSTSGSTIKIAGHNTSSAIELMMVANVSFTDPLVLGETTLTAGSTTRNDLISALSYFDYDVTSLDGYIPMFGTATLSSGISSSGSYSISLTRSVVQLSLYFEFTLDEGVTFIPKDIYLRNVNTKASVYTDGSEANIPSQEKTTRHYEMSSESDASSYSLQIYFAETTNISATHYDDYTSVPEGYSSSYADLRTTLVIGGYLQTNTETEYWYRLDFIPTDDSGGDLDEELATLYRNHNYQFTVENLKYIGSTYYDTTGDVEGVYSRQYPDNVLIFSSGSGYFYITDDTITSVTAEYANNSDNTPVYVGVSEINTEMAWDSVCERVSVVTNYYSGSTAAWRVDWTLIDEKKISYSQNIPSGNDDDGNAYSADNPALCTLWLWNEGLEESDIGNTYTYYITASNIRKHMTITITE